MAMPQRDDTIEALKRLDLLLEYAVMHGDEAETERLREVRGLTAGGGKRGKYQGKCERSWMEYARHNRMRD